MHIQEGFLTAKWAATWYGAAVIFVGKGLRDVTRKVKEIVMFKPLVGLVGAAVFFMSLLPIPHPAFGTSSHATGTPLAAILLGPFVGTVLSVVALLLQAVFFAHGGITTLGANVMSMGVVGSLVGYGVFRLGQRFKLSLAISAGIAGLVGDISVYVMSSLELALGVPKEVAVVNHMTFGQAWVTFLGVYIPTQSLIAVLEGLVTAGVISYIAKVRPDILQNLSLLPRIEEDQNYGQQI